MDLSGFLTAQVVGFFLVFARLGSAMVFMPGFGEQLITVRYRLLFAIVLSAALFPAVPVGPLAIDTPLLLLPLFAIEVTVGLWIGLTARILMTALQFAGYQIGLVSGLANAFAPETSGFQGASLIAAAMMMAGAALIFASDLHHVIIGALVMTYDVFPLGQIMPGDLAEQTVMAVGMSFYIGVSLSAPFYVMSLVLNVGLGLSNRMMPTLPVFFVAAPVLIGAGLFVLLMAAPAMYQTYLDSFADWLGRLSF